MKENALPPILGYCDIETAPVSETYAGLSDLGKQAFCKKFRKEVENGVPVEKLYKENAALHAEFAQVICIALGVILKNTEGEYIYLKCFSGTEQEIFTQFFEACQKAKVDNLCAHYGKGFDYPFICKRMIINGLVVPPILEIAGKKPWEIKLLDTQEMWQFGDFKGHTSLITLCHAFDVPSPKDDMDGSMVPAAFYAGKIKDIKQYCMNDVFSLANVHRKMCLLPLISTQKRAE